MFKLKIVLLFDDKGRTYTKLIKADTHKVSIRFFIEWYLPHIHLMSLGSLWKLL